MIWQLAFRTLRQADKRCLWKFCWNFGVMGTLGILKFKRRLKKGIHFPPFLYISITNSCNLRCQGCWIDVESERKLISLEAMNRVILDAKKQGNRFFGILGGEPFLHPQLMEILAAHPDCYFQIFTNGHFITRDVARQLRRLANATVLVSVEGRELTSDQRRGKKDVFNKTIEGLDNCLKEGLLTGVATSLCQNNTDELLSEHWLQELIDRGVHYVWYHMYRPVGPKMNSQLALRPEQHLQVRKFVVEMRTKMPIGFVDAYYGADGRALCSLVTGICHHIGPMGDIEPCPIIQFATENISDPRGVVQAIQNSAFLQGFRREVGRTTRGCVVLERPDLVRQLVLKHRARDTTLRGTALAELDAMQCHCSQYLPGQQIPEKHWLYRLSKRFLFDDFGAYDHLQSETNRTDASA